MSEEIKCPVTGKTKKVVAGGGASNRDWWPNQLNLKILHQNSSLSSPMGEEFNYPEEFKKLDLHEIKKDFDYFILVSTCNYKAAHKENAKKILGKKYLKKCLIHMTHFQIL